MLTVRLFIHIYRQAGQLKVCSKGRPGKQAGDKEKEEGEQEEGEGEKDGDGSSSHDDGKGNGSQGMDYRHGSSSSSSSSSRGGYVMDIRYGEDVTQAVYWHAYRLNLSYNILGQLDQQV